jgi:hypothetical protein
MMLKMIEIESYGADETEDNFFVLQGFTFAS